MRAMKHDGQKYQERVRKLYERHKKLHALLRKHGADILESENFKKTQAHIQHGTMSVHNHVMNVARYSLLLNSKLGLRCNKHDLISCLNVLKGKVPIISTT